MKQPKLFRERYGEKLTVSQNRKGVLDVDTVKGCSLGMAARKNGGCYNACYAAKTAELYGQDFPVSVSRRPEDKERKLIEKKIREHPASWFRIGNMGDPCHDWDNTIETCEWLHTIKQPIVVTKHWRVMTEAQIEGLRRAGLFSIRLFRPLTLMGTIAPTSAA